MWKAFPYHYLIYTEFTFKKINPKKPVHNTVKFRDMKQFNPDIFINDLNNYEVLNGSLCDQDISWDEWKVKFNEICNKHAPIKVARLKKRSNPWITPDVVKLMYKRDHVHAKAVRTKNDILFDQYRSLRNYVTKIIKENKQKYYNEINSLSASDPKKCGRKSKNWFQINLDRTQSTVIFLLVALINISLILPKTWMINSKWNQVHSYGRVLGVVTNLSFNTYRTWIFNAISTLWPINMETIFWIWM